MHIAAVKPSIHTVLAWIALTVDICSHKQCKKAGPYIVYFAENKAKWHYEMSRCIDLDCEKLY